MQDDFLNKIQNLLDSELEIYRTLRRMVSRELEAIILNENMDELLQLLQEKQEVIARLQLLSDSWVDELSVLGFTEPRGGEGFWEKLLAFFPPDQAELLENMLSEIRAAADDLMKSEGEVQKELEKHVQQLREKMLHMTQGRSAFIGYAKMGGAHIDFETQ